MPALQKFHRFGIEFQASALLVNGIETREQSRVEQNGVPMCREFRSHFGFDLLHLRIVLDPFRLKKVDSTRSSNSPDFSKATTVFSKLGRAGSWSTASTSLPCSPMPASKAGRKSDSLMRSKGGK